MKYLLVFIAGFALAFTLCFYGWENKKVVDKLPAPKYPIALDVVPQKDSENYVEQEIRVVNGGRFLVTYVWKRGHIQYSYYDEIHKMDSSLILKRQKQGDSILALLELLR